MKKCPLCAEEIQDDAIACKHCGAMFTRGPSGTAARRQSGSPMANSPQAHGQAYDTLDETFEQTGQATILAGQYRVVRKIAEGGMGVVYLAEDIEMGSRQVAVKVLSPLLTRSERAVENLRSEAMLARELDHPNIIRVYGFHSDEEIKFLVMEYIEGETLEKKLITRTGNKLSLSETIAIVEEVSAALDAAHSHSPPVIHRDLKPSNIMIAKTGRVKVLDFGVAREMHDSYTMLTGKSDVSGTLAYMSPEQLKGRPPTALMDIYALAVLTYECLNGSPPFSHGDIQYQILHEKPRPIPTLPKTVNDVIQAGMDKKSQNRPQTAWQFVQNIKAATADSPAIQTDRAALATMSRSAASQAMDKLAKKRSKSKWAIAIVALVLLVAAAAAWLMMNKPDAAIEPIEPIAQVDQVDAAEAIAIPATVSASNASIIASVAEPTNEEMTPARDAAPQPHDFTETLPGGIELHMVYIEPGTFHMGVSPSFRGDVLAPQRIDEQPRHKVTITKPYYIGQTEISQQQYQAVMDDEAPGTFRGGDLPVETISWIEARNFCRRLSELTGKTYRLPSEAQWEYACRAGSAGRYCFGDDTAQLGLYAWYSANSQDRSNPVGIRMPNAWGLYDMHGNVAEWCQDYYDSQGYPSDGEPATDPTGIRRGSKRAIRGGAFNQRGGYLCSIDRDGFWPTYHNFAIGFRVLCEIK